MLGANTRPRHHPESRVQRYRFRVAAAAKTLAAREGTRVGGRRRAGWAQRNRHHDGHAVVALHVLALRVSARLPLIPAHHHPRIPVRTCRQRAATEGQHRRRWCTRTYSTSTSSLSFLLSLVLLVGVAVSSFGRGRASAKGPRQLLAHP